MWVCESDNKPLGTGFWGAQIYIDAPGEKKQILRNDISKWFQMHAFRMSFAFEWIGDQSFWATTKLSLYQSLDQICLTGLTTFVDRVFNPGKRRSYHNRFQLAEFDDFNRKSTIHIDLLSVAPKSYSILTTHSEIICFSCPMIIDGPSHSATVAFVQGSWSPSATAWQERCNDSHGGRESWWGSWQPKVGITVSCLHLNRVGWKEKQHTNNYKY